MKTLAAICCALFVASAAVSAEAQVFTTYYAAPAVVAPAPVLLAPPPVPVVTYYHAPVVAYTPGYYFGPAPVYVGRRAFTVRQRVYVRGQPVRNTLRVLAP